MNTHKHARLTFVRRLKMVKQMTLQGFDAARAGAAQGVTAQTARKWLGRYLSGGDAALGDASSRPTRSPRAIDESKALLIVELRKRRMLQSRSHTHESLEHEHAHTHSDEHHKHDHDVMPSGSHSHRHHHSHLEHAHPHVPDAHHHQHIHERL